MNPSNQPLFRKSGSRIDQGDLHFRESKWIVISGPSLPFNAISKRCVTPSQVGAVEIRQMASFVPPRSFIRNCTIFCWRQVMVSVECCKFHTICVWQTISCVHKIVFKSLLLNYLIKVLKRSKFRIISGVPSKFLPRLNCTWTSSPEYVVKLVRCGPAYDVTPLWRQQETDIVSVPAICAAAVCLVVPEYMLS